MIKVITAQPIYSTCKNGKRGRIIGCETIREEIEYHPDELDEYGKVKPKTEDEKRADTEKFIWAITGMSLDDFARKILIDYNREIHYIE